MSLHRKLLYLNDQRRLSMNSEEGAKIEREIFEIRIESKKYESMMYEFRKQKIIGRRNYVQFEN